MSHKTVGLLLLAFSFVALCVAAGLSFRHLFAGWDENIAEIRRLAKESKEVLERAIDFPIKITGEDKG